MRSKTRCYSRLKRYPKGDRNANRPAGDSDFAVDWCASHLAIQLRMELLPQRRTRSGPAAHRHSGSDWPPVKSGSPFTNCQGWRVAPAVNPLARDLCLGCAAARKLSSLQIRRQQKFHVLFLIPSAKMMSNTLQPFQISPLKPLKFIFIRKMVCFIRCRPYLMLAVAYL